MSGSRRDLAANDPWKASLERSRARRERARRGWRRRPAAVNQLLASSSLNHPRDLADEAAWQLSLGRSRARRRAAEMHFVPSSTRAKRLSIGALAAFTFGPTASIASGQQHPTSVPDPEPATTSEHVLVLSEGTEGRQVQLLQRALGGIKVDGVFGPETEAAVRSFQATHGLAVDGVFGAETGRALRLASGAHTAFAADMQNVDPETSAPSEGGETTATTSARELTEPQSESTAPPAAASTPSASGEGGEPQASSEAGSGQHERQPGAAVSRLQAALHLPVDGEFGPETEAAVRRLQSRHGLSVDGVVGPQTWGVIGVEDEETLTPPPSALPQPEPQHESTTATVATHDAQEGEASAHEAPAAGGSQAISRLQAALHLPVDGEFGPETEAAVRRLQARHGVSVDGVVGAATWSLIGVDNEATLTPPASARAVPASEGRPSDGGEGGSGGGTGDGGEGGGGGGEGVVGRVIAAGEEIATRPYVWGGGHGSFQSEGYDCSGSVSYALHGGGLLSSPEDSSELENYGAPGPGRHITIYANAEHAFMVVDGRRFDTVALAESGNRWSSSMTSTSGYVVRHPEGE
jgi:peptidoglycan hydrolase-like protein with peptidoglycan-binding domain